MFSSIKRVKLKEDMLLTTFDLNDTDRIKYDVNGTQIRLNEDEQICFYGRVALTIISGHINIYGYDATITSNTLSLYSNNWNPGALLSFKAITNSVILLQYLPSRFIQDKPLPIKYQNTQEEKIQKSVVPKIVKTDFHSFRRGWCYSQFFHQYANT